MLIWLGKITMIISKKQWYKIYLEFDSLFLTTTIKNLIKITYFKQVYAIFLLKSFSFNKWRKHVKYGILYFRPFTGLKTIKQIQWHQFLKKINKSTYNHFYIKEINKIVIWIWKIFRREFKNRKNMLFFKTDEQITW